MKRSIGGATSGKRKGPKSKPKKPKTHPKKHKKKISAKGRYTISQPKKRYTVHMPRFRKRKPRSSFRSMSFSDESSYSNVRGKQDFKRRSTGKRNINGKRSGLELEQDNDRIRIQRL
jgi:hypothetical protein